MKQKNFNSINVANKIQLKDIVVTISINCLKLNKKKITKISKVLSLIQQTHQGGCSNTLDRTGGNMVLQTFDLGYNGDNMPPYAGDYAPTNTFYTDLDSNIYSQGN